MKKELEELTHSDIKEAITIQKNKALKNDNRVLSKELQYANDLVEYWRKKYNTCNKKYKIERDKINNAIEYMKQNAEDVGFAYKITNQHFYSELFDILTK